MVQIISVKEGHVENDYSDPGKITSGVTQVSMLGPLIFLLL